MRFKYFATIFISLVLAISASGKIYPPEYLTYSLTSGETETQTLDNTARTIAFSVYSATGTFDLTVELSVDGTNWDEAYSSGTVSAIANELVAADIYSRGRITVKDKSLAANTVLVVVRPFSSAVAKLDKLRDVSATAPSDDDVLTYNSTTSKWTAGAQTAINHDALTGFVANEHIDHTTVSISSGGILSGGGTIAATRTITLASSDVDHDGTTNFVSNEHTDHSGVSISSGGILSGGGDITTTRTITLASSDVDHDSTTNFDANEHVDHTAVSISSGGILSGGGTIDGNQTITLASSSVDHDATANFAANEHIDWTGASSNFQTSGTSYFGDGSNYTSTEVDGTLVFTGNATVWNDICVPLSATQVNPATSKPDFAIFRNGVYAFGFDDAADESVNFTAEIHHDWREGSMIYPHFHWGIATAGSAGGAENVKWGLEYTVANKTGDTFGATTTIYSDTIDIQNESQYEAFMTSVGSGIDMTGYTISNIIIGRLFRDTSVANDFAPDAYGFIFDFHYEIDTVGSRAAATK